VIRVAATHQEYPMTTTTNGQADALRDAAALLEAIARNDRKAGEVILDHADTREVAQILAAAIVAADRTALPGITAALATGMRTRSPEGTT
jgi:hypothetical protein